MLLFVNANQTLILSEATQQVENQNAPAMGRPACAIVPQVMNTGRAALSLGCCGARAYLDVLTDDVAVFAIPGAKLEAYAQADRGPVQGQRCSFQVPSNPPPRRRSRRHPHDQGLAGCLGALDDASRPRGWTFVSRISLARQTWTGIAMSQGAEVPIAAIPEHRRFRRAWSEAQAIDLRPISGP